MQFYRILDMLPKRWRSHYVVLALTGLAIDELYALQLEDLEHDARRIRVKDPKTASGVRTVYVAEQFWPWVRAAIPVPVTRRHLREQWNAAVDRAGFRKVSLAALRQLRRGVLAKAEVERGLRVTESDEEFGTGNSLREATLLVEHLQVLALTEQEGRRLLLRRVSD
jgi:integrase